MHDDRDRRTSDARRKAQLAEDLDVVGLAERGGRRPGDDEQRMRLQVPEHVALLGQLVERLLRER